MQLCDLWHSLHRVAHYHRQGSGGDDSDDDGDAIELLSCLATLRPRRWYPRSPNHHLWSYRATHIVGDLFFWQARPPCIIIRIAPETRQHLLYNCQKAKVLFLETMWPLKSDHNVDIHCERSPIRKENHVETNRSFILCANFNSSLDLSWVF